MRTFAFFLALALVANIGLAQGGTNDGLDLTSAVNAGAFDASNKTVAGGDVFSIRMEDNGAGCVGNVIAIGGDLVPCGFPICIDLDANPATCELELGVNLFFIVDPGASVLPQVLPAAGYQLGIAIPNDASIFAAPDDEALRVQTACANAATALGISISNALEAAVGNVQGQGPTTDDGNVAISLGSGIDFYGVTETDLFINSNGNLTLGSSDSDFSSSEAEMLSDQPRIAPAWTDISPNIDGNISYILDRACGGDINSITVNYDAIPNFGEGAGNNLHTMSATLYANGDIDMSWTGLDSNGDNLLAGISPGNGISLANPVDFTAGGAIVGAAFQALHQNFDGSCGNEAQRLEGAMGTFTYDGVSAYTYNGTAAPTPGIAATNVSPDSGDDTGGQTVQVLGAFFDLAGVYNIEFGAGNPATGVSVIDACTLECTTPAGTGTVDVIVTDTNTLDSATITGGFTYVPAGVVTQDFNVVDDGSGNYVMSSAPASFTFYGVSYSDLFVNANGNVTFNSSDSDFTATEAEFLNDQPRIAPFWDDLGPSTINVTETASDITISYSSPHHSGAITGLNVAAIVLDKATGNISINFTSADAFDGTGGTETCLTGISAGGGLGVNTVVDLNGATTLAGAPDDALIEGFSGGNFDLVGGSATFTATGGAGTGPYQSN